MWLLIALFYCLIGRTGEPKRKDSIKQTETSRGFEGLLTRVANLFRVKGQDLIGWTLA